MRWKFTLHAEVAGSLYNPSPKELLPHAVDKYARSKRMLFAEHPFCEAEPVLFILCGVEGKDRLRCRCADYIAGSIVGAALKDMRWSIDGTIAHDHHIEFS